MTTLENILDELDETAYYDKKSGRPLITLEEAVHIVTKHLSAQAATSTMELPHFHITPVGY